MVYNGRIFTIETVRTQTALRPLQVQPRRNRYAAVSMNHSLGHYRHSHFDRVAKPLLLLAAFVSASAIASTNSRPALNNEPSPELTPEQVIGHQIRALSADGEIRDRIEHCYRFASPSNRRYTGPIDKFEKMIQSPEYRVLLDARKFLVGRALVESPDLVHLLLTVVDKDGNLVCFRCFLTKQTAPPYQGCWMTDTVVRFGGIQRGNREQDQPPRDNETI